MQFDILELYRWSVQDPDTHAAVLDRMYLQLRHKQPTVLREDFAGTSADSVAWVRAGDQRRAIAVECDAPTVAWAKARWTKLLGAAAGRLQYVTSDVFAVAPPQVEAADVISALNFSLLFLKSKEQLSRYFQHARASLADDGIFVANLFGGPGAMRKSLDRRRITPQSTTENVPPPFEYQWEQRAYDAVSGQIDCRIHFALDEPVGQKIADAFVYDWRLWTIPELVELMREADFADVQVWRHTYDAAKGADGVFLGPVSTLTNQETWIAYVIGLK
ncbi:class I SAM-dependent methyltransferase [bacterium]|nr:class I SAM-dependent methyltransferase [bacterium]